VCVLNKGDNQQDAKVKFLRPTPDFNKINAPKEYRYKGKYATSPCQEDRKGGCRKNAKEKDSS
jgi:hypothetical protein